VPQVCVGTVGAGARHQPGDAGSDGSERTGGAADATGDARPLGTRLTPAERRLVNHGAMCYLGAAVDLEGLVEATAKAPAVGALGANA
jgi:hypothetical protein